ncbi:YdcF family protein [Neobacillus massiliamazoniensis]|uniref:Putative cytoplasmic protein n=1 Tax=Neobacillus massiliamazoniensis TaxID=1499688 RepID=A0A0U1NTG9_9BACI|nr:YdcF family protein [Neobacillus massiliamazoniensis]CRK81032.1 putative cytoplasmic protein [Neobacillus massiliamazoniensis]
MKNKKKILFTLGIIVGIGLIYLVFLQVKISQYSHLEPPKNADYVIILGAKVNGKVPSLVLQSRIDAAAKYLTENKNTIAIASGGKGSGEDISEAEAIKNELMKKGIDESRVIMENRSTNTVENIEFSKKLIPKNAKSGIVVTNTFHMYRSLSIAHDQGLTLSGLPAETPANAVIKSYSREYLAITKYYLQKLFSVGVF